MKKVILFAAILFAGVSVVKAQDSNEVVETKASGSINLKVNLSPFQSILIGGTTSDEFDGTNLNLNYLTMDNYDKGVSAKINNHIEVIAAGKYSVTVEKNNPTSNGFDFSTISVLAEGGTGAGSTGEEGNLTLKEVKLTDKAETLITSSKGTAGKAYYNVTYTGADKNLYGDLVVDGQLTTYETNVLYTITAN